MEGTTPSQLRRSGIYRVIRSNRLSWSKGGATPAIVQRSTMITKMKGSKVLRKSANKTRMIRASISMSSL